MRIAAAGLAAMLWVSSALAGGGEEMREFAFTPEDFRAAFDRQAGRDGTDAISQCVEVHRVSNCRFRMKAFARAAPGEASATASDRETEMPDEEFDFLRFESWRMGAISFDGSAATAARRGHFIGQFKTLLRVLEPSLGASEIERIVDGLGLTTMPAQLEVERRVERPFARMTCRQGAGAASWIRCSIAPPK
jgi:hypothetical protein